MVLGGYCAARMRSIVGETMRYKRRRYGWGRRRILGVLDEKSTIMCGYEKICGMRRMKGLSFSFISNGGSCCALRSVSGRESGTCIPVSSSGGVHHPIDRRGTGRLLSGLTRINVLGMGGRGCERRRCGSYVSDFYPRG